MKVEGLEPEAFDGCPRYLSLQRFAELVGLADSPQTLALWVRQGIIPVTDLNGHSMVDLHALRARRDGERR